MAVAQVPYPGAFSFATTPAEAVGWGRATQLQKPVAGDLGRLDGPSVVWEYRQGAVGGPAVRQVAMQCSI